MPIPEQIALTLRIPKGDELTAQEGDNNWLALRDAILSLAATVKTIRVVVGPEPPLGERVDGLIWVPTENLEGIFRWKSSTSEWVRIIDPPLYNSTGGSGANYTLALAWAFDNNSDLIGHQLVIKADRTNITPTTLNVNTLGPVPIKKFGSSGIADIVAGEIRQNGLYEVVFDGTNFILLNPNPVASSIAEGGTYAVYEERQSAGTAGGDFTSGSWQQRLLNTQTYDPSLIGSLQSNRVRLQAGTYRFKAKAICFRVGTSRLRLYNSTLAASISGSASLSGSDEIGDDNGNATDQSDGEFTISGQSDIELQHQCGTTRAADGRGAASNLSEPEIYARLELWKIA